MARRNNHNKTRMRPSGTWLPAAQPSGAPARVVDQARAVAVGLCVQGLVLAAWAHALPLRAAVLLGLFAAAALWSLRKGSRRPSPHAVMLSLGGAGMGLGAWMDAGFHRPACLCCIYDGSTGLWQIWRTSLASMSVLLMLAVPLLWHLRFAPLPAQQAQSRARLLQGATEACGMAVGMLAAGWLAAPVVRALPSYKLELGFLCMLLGMLVGGWLSGFVLSAWRRRPT